MVLTRRGGAGAARVSRSRLHGGERGAQSLEFAMMLPAVVLVVVLLIHAALLGAELVAVHGIAREAARTAAVEDDAAVRDAVRAAAGRAQVVVQLRPTSPRAPGDQVTATVRLRSRAFAPFGASIELPAKATMRVEQG